MFESLTGRLTQVMKSLRGEARLTESNIQDALREVRVALLEADVALPVVRDFVARAEGELGGIHVAVNNAVDRAAEGGFLQVADNEVRVVTEKAAKA